MSDGPPIKPDGPPNPRKVREKGPTSRNQPNPKSIQLAHPGTLAVNSDPQFKYPHRMTVGAHQRLADLNFDPLEWSVKIARGEALTTNHPFLEMIRDWYMDMISHLTKGNAINWERELEKILEKAKVSLTDSWVPLNLRSDHIKELMQYLYPKLKAVEHSGSIQQDIRIKPLSRNEVEIFKEVFDEEY